VLRRAQSVVAVSRFVAQVARATLSDVPMEVVYNGVDPERFRHHRPERNPGRPFRLFFAGSWIARKGVDLLAPIMRELGDGFELEYTGGPAAAKDRAGMPPNMHDAGRLDATGVADAMRRADALIFPSRSEGLALVVAEAMACGLPVIAARASPLPEMVLDGVSGVLCQPDSVADFADAVRNLAADAELTASMSVSAARVASDRFTLDRMVTAYLEVYRHVLS